MLHCLCAVSPVRLPFFRRDSSTRFFTCRFALKASGLYVNAVQYFHWPFFRGGNNNNSRIRGSWSGAACLFHENVLCPAVPCRHLRSIYYFEYFPPIAVPTYCMYVAMSRLLYCAACVVSNFLLFNLLSFLTITHSPLFNLLCLIGIYWPVFCYSM